MLRLVASAFRSKSSISIVLAALALAPACKGKSESAAAETGDLPSGGSHGGDTHAAPSVRSKMTLFRPLLDEAGRAELNDGGLFIDFGTSDQHKYTRGGWHTGWGELHESEEEAGDTWGEVTGRRAWLDMITPMRPPAAIVMRARSHVPGQKITFYVGTRALGTVSLTPGWTTARVKLADGALPAGLIRFELRSSKSSSGTPRAEVSWIWFPRSAGAEPPASVARVRPLNLGGQARRALAAPGPRAYSFYLQPPPHSHLVVDLGVAKRAHFTVSAAADGVQPTTLLDEDRKTPGWVERDISLDKLAGRAVRLTLRTDQQDGQAGWGEPEILLDRPAGAAVAKPAVAASGRPAKNLIFILMDTARADAFSPFKGPEEGWKAQTPNYDRLASEGTVFTGAYDNENWTKPSVASVLTGLYPSTHDTKKDSSVLPDDVEMVSEHFKKLGFATAGFVANGYVSDKFGFEQGWDTFKNYIRLSLPSQSDHVYHDGVAWLEQHQKTAPQEPFFLYLQIIDPHVPYREDGDAYKKYFEGDYHGPLGGMISSEDQVALSKKKIHPTDTDLKWLRAHYWGEVSFHDTQMGWFMDQLHRMGLEDQTLLVATNDHGEELGERGRFGHGHQVHEELIRAPTVIRYKPLFPPGKVIPDLIEQVDTMPTLLDAMGQPPLKHADGQSWLPLVKGDPVPRPRYTITEFLDGFRVVRIGHYKLITSAGTSTQLYDLKADPGERHDLEKGAPIARRLCQVFMGEGLGVPEKAARQRGVSGRRKFKAGTANIDPETRRQLQALGYLGSGNEDHGKKKDKKKK